MCAITERPEPQGDVLAQVTHRQRLLFLRAHATWLKLLNSKTVRFVAGTTQPAHAVVAGVVALVASFCLPAAFSSDRPSSLTLFIYLASIALHIGDQFWMTFVSGLCLYFSLPRHAFGEVQKVLFPKYFAINAMLSALTLITFTRLHKSHHYAISHWFQLGSIVLCFLIELGIRVYLVPPVVSLITQKTQIEKTEPGVGEEVGTHNPGRLAHCPHYARLHSSFRKLHLCVAFGNILTMACTTLQLVYLQQNYACLA